MKHIAGARGVDDFLRRNLQRRHVLDGPAFIVKQHALCAAGDGAEIERLRSENARLRTVLEPFVARAYELDQIAAVRKHAAEGEASVPLSALRAARDAWEGEA